MIGASFEEISWHGDVIYFEFCFHEMADPEWALEHASTVAADVVVFDHLPGSEWIFQGAEEDKVECSWQVLERAGVRRRQSFVGEQRFRDYGELIAKVGVQGPVAIERAQRFRDATNIVIPMRYGLALL